MSLAELAAPDAAAVEADVARALAEDIGSGDVTAALLPDRPDSAYLLCKQDAVIAGRPWFDATHRALDPQVRIDWRVAEGDHVAAGTVLAILHGHPVRDCVTRRRCHHRQLRILESVGTPSAGRTRV